MFSPLQSIQDNEHDEIWSEINYLYELLNQIEKEWKKELKRIEKELKKLEKEIKMLKKEMYEK